MPRELGENRFPLVAWATCCFTLRELTKLLLHVALMQGQHIPRGDSEERAVPCGVAGVGFSQWFLYGSAGGHVFLGNSLA